MSTSLSWRALPLLAIAGVLAGAITSCGRLRCDSGARCRPDASTPDGGDAGSSCALRCGPAGLCCGAAEDCVADRCLPSCAGARCEASGALCCEGSELCAGDRCVAPGTSCAADADCGAGEACEPLVGRCIPVPGASSCGDARAPFAVEPVEQWMQPGTATSVPLVVSLTDDDGNGVIDEDDVPDVVVALSTGLGGSETHLTAFSGDDGRLLWRARETAMVYTSPAAGDLDGDGTVEIVTLIAGEPPRVAIYDHTGVLETSAPSLDAPYAYTLADLDADGRPEIIGTTAVYEGDGQHRFDMPEMLFVPVILDVNDDGHLDVVGRDAAYDGSGRHLWGREPFDVNFDILAVGHVLAGTSGPQIVSVGGAGELVVIDPATGVEVLGPLPIPGISGATGSPTIADFDGDGAPEIGVLGRDAYVVLDLSLPAPYVLWSQPVHDVSDGSAGSTVFDFDGDGAPEVVYNDECHLQIRSGRTGELLWSTPSPTGTILELPVVADVDGDGSAELVTVTNDTIFRFDDCSGRGLPWSRPPTGVRVYHDVSERWMPTRGIWNEHAYHIDNVRDDGSIPGAEGWATHGSYRVNLAEASPGGADLVIAALRADPSACPAAVTLWARVQNQGVRGTPAGVGVTFRRGSPDAPGEVLGLSTTTSDLLPGGGEWVRLEVRSPPVGPDGSLSFFAVVDEGAAGDTGALAECREDNNESAGASTICAELM